MPRRTRASGAGGVNHTASYVGIAGVLAGFHREHCRLFWMRQPWADEARTRLRPQVGNHNRDLRMVRQRNRRSERELAVFDNTFQRDDWHSATSRMLCSVLHRRIDQEKPP